jgi:hypothetical protein
MTTATAKPKPKPQLRPRKGTIKPQRNSVMTKALYDESLFAHMSVIQPQIRVFLPLMDAMQHAWGAFATMFTGPPRP